MKTHARTPLQSKTQGIEKTTAPAIPAIATGPALGQHGQRRQLEKSIALTRSERLRCLWYRLRLTIREMNYATRRMAELQARLP